MREGVTMNANQMAKELLGNRKLEGVFGEALSHDEVVSLLQDIKTLITACYIRHESYEREERKAVMLLEKIRYELEELLSKVCDVDVDEFMDQLPKILDLLDTDIQALFDGDPAAESKEAIILAYPGFFAIMTYRVAHVLYELKVPVIPRIMSEYAHSVSGIDINPGATIGEYFFIDHGTGVVIGETCRIGDHVKLYQGVTLGALSTRKGQLLSGVIRHPTIESNVTIYAGAVILGGETVIGEGSTIGGGVFITESIPPNSRVSTKLPEMNAIG